MNIQTMDMHYKRQKNFMRPEKIQITQLIRPNPKNVLCILNLLLNILRNSFFKIQIIFFLKHLEKYLMSESSEPPLKKQKINEIISGKKNKNKTKNI